MVVDAHTDAAATAATKNGFDTCDGVTRVLPDAFDELDKAGDMAEEPGNKILLTRIYLN